MPADLRKARELLDQFKTVVAAHTSGPIPPDTTTLLTNLKLVVMGFPSLPPSVSKSDTTQGEVRIAREMLEQATILSAKAQDERAFERHVLQAKALYTDYSKVVEPSANYHLIQGLNLMHLLIGNRLAEFHSELELMDAGSLTHPLVAYPIKLEEWLMEGSYNKILSSCRDVPEAAYLPFIARLTDTVRDEIADCSAASYDTLSLEAAQRMMVFGSQEELLAYVHEKQPEWHVESGVIHFNDTQKARLEVPAMTLIANNLAYATELERIV